MAAKTKAPTTSLIKCTPDITRTQAMIAARTASKMPVNHKGEAEGEHIKTVNAIINAEKTCLLGKDLPWVSFGMTGGISNFFVWAWSVYDISENRYCNKADKRSND